MIVLGKDEYGAEYRRTSNDFSFRWLEQDNCVCSICHAIGAKIEFGYVTRNYESTRHKGKTRQNLKAHRHCFWICPKCLTNLDRKASKVKDLVKQELEKVVESEDKE